MNEAREIIESLQRAGFLALLVGGCVRDLMRGITPKDYDVATSATPDQILMLFPDALGIGAQFGVMVVNGIEVATLREDRGTDGRRPERVIYTDSIYRDARRRDFTVNGMYFDPVTQQTYDFFDGTRDIANKIIRCIGRPQDRFAEDGLRAFRAIRLATQMGFNIDPEIMEVIKNGNY